MSDVKTTIVERLADDAAAGIFLDRRALLPAVPPPVEDLAALTKSVRAIKTILDAREGQGSSALEEAVTVRKLVELGVQIQIGNVTLGDPLNRPEPPPTVSVGFPIAGNVGYVDPRPVLTSAPLPTNLTVQGAVQTIFVSWDLIDYQNHAFIEVWRNTTNNVATATKLGNSTGLQYVDVTGAMGVTYWYFVRAIAVAEDGSLLTGAYTLGVSGGRGQVGGVDLGPLIVEAGNLANGSVGTTKITDDAVTSQKIVANAVVAGKIAANAIGATQIIADSITGDRIAAATIAGDRIQANTITASNIQAGSITGDRLQANTITAGQIAANTITGSRIAGSTITADKMSVTSLSAITGTMGTLNAGVLTLDNAGGWSYVRSANKWWADATNGFVFAGYAPDSSSFMDVRSGNSYIRMSAGASVGATQEISFNSGQILLRGTDGYFSATNAYVRGDIQATSINASSVGIVNTLNLAGEAVIVPRSTSCGLVQVGALVGRQIMAVALNPGNGSVFLSATIEVMGGGFTPAVTFQFRRDGTPLRTFALADSSGPGYNQTQCITYVDPAPGAASYTYDLFVIRQAAGDVVSGVASGTLFALGVKNTGS
ncbi:MAG: hypothetical protein ACK54C_02095 [Betaproteobacteria bacterium]